MTHSRHLARSMERSSNVAERFFRSYKQRIRRMVCFMSKKGCDHFNAAWQVYINFERYQRRKERKRKKYRYPGRSPLEVAGADLQNLTWLDVIGLGRPTTPFPHYPEPLHTAR